MLCIGQAARVTVRFPFYLSSVTRTVRFKWIANPPDPLRHFHRYALQSAVGCSAGECDETCAATAVSTRFSNTLCTLVVGEQYLY